MSHRNQTEIQAALDGGRTSFKKYITDILKTNPQNLTLASREFLRHLDASKATSGTDSTSYPFFVFLHLHVRVIGFR